MRSLVAAIALLGVPSAALPLAARGTPSVDLGYAIYEGTQDSKNGINVFKGFVIRVEMYRVGAALMSMQDSLRCTSGRQSQVRGSPITSGE